LLVASSNILSRLPRVPSLLNTRCLFGPLSPGLHDLVHSLPCLLPWSVRSHTPDRSIQAHDTGPGSSPLAHSRLSTLIKQFHRPGRPQWRLTRITVSNNTITILSHNPRNLRSTTTRPCPSRFPKSSSTTQDLSNTLTSSRSLLLILSTSRKRRSLRRPRRSAEPSASTPTSRNRARVLGTRSTYTKPTRRRSRNVYTARRIPRWP
jgi:hypothetical protein